MRAGGFSPVASEAGGGSCSRGTEGEWQRGGGLPRGEGPRIGRAWSGPPLGSISLHNRFRVFGEEEDGCTGEVVEACRRAQPSPRHRRDGGAPARPKRGGDLPPRPAGAAVEGSPPRDGRRGPRAGLPARAVDESSGLPRAEVVDVVTRIASPRGDPGECGSLTEQQKHGGGSSDEKETCLTSSTPSPVTDATGGGVKVTDQQGSEVVRKSGQDGRHVSGDGCADPKEKGKRIDPAPGRGRHGRGGQGDGPAGQRRRRRLQWQHGIVANGSEDRRVRAGGVEVSSGSNGSSWP